MTGAGELPLLCCCIPCCAGTGSYRATAGICATGLVHLVNASLLVWLMPVPASRARLATGAAQLRRSHRSAHQRLVL